MDIIPPSTGAQWCAIKLGVKERKRKEKEKERERGREGGREEKNASNLIPMGLIPMVQTHPPWLI